MPREVIRASQREVTFNFTCEGCGSQGELTIPIAEQLKPLGCPEGCGATYVMWRPSLTWTLRCVVKPYFAEGNTA